MSSYLAHERDFLLWIVLDVADGLVELDEELLVGTSLLLIDDNYERHEGSFMIPDLVKPI